VVVEPDGGARLLEGNGIILGLGANHDRTEQKLGLRPGARLLLYTDGLVERRDQSMDERLEELRATVADLADASLEELCDEVLARMLPVGSDDDVALVAVEVFED
jgi:serine phosphatase RsbU (regulator of sigma subunit)